jgi:translation initiation factor 1 (eIF-1/SUI1)
VGLSFKPTTAAAKTASLTIKSTAAGSPNTVALKGTGTSEPAATATLTLTPTSLDFGNQAVKAASAVQTITLKNDGKADLGKLAFTVDGTDKKDFELDKKSTTCKTTLATGAECKVGLIFKPTTAAAKSATLTVKSDAAGSPNTVALKGTGVVEQAAATLTPSSLDFGNQVLKQASAVKTVTLKNDGKAELGKLAFTVDGTDKKDFALDKKATTCKTTLAAGKDCTVGVIFTPTTAAAKSATLTIK